MTPKQKTAIAALVVAALVSISAMFAPGLKCAPDPKLIEDALGDESGSKADTSTPDASGAKQSPDLGSSAGSSESGGSSGA